MSKITDFFLGIDLGTSSVKVLITSAKGDILSRGEVSYPINIPAPGQAEQDPEDWWRATVEGVNQAVRKLTGSRTRIACIGLTGQMHGTVLLDKQGNAIAPAVVWPDQRSKRQVDEFTALLGSRQLIRLTGSPAATGFQAATILWYRQNRARLWAEVDKILLPKDYLRWRLTGEYCTDPSDASGTLLFNINRRRWSTRILDLVGIEQRQLPVVGTSDAISGRILGQVAADLGVTKNTPVVTGAGDVACGLLGAGVTHDKKLLITISTGGQITLPASGPKVDTFGRIHTFCSALSPEGGKAGYLQLGAILSAGRSLRWLRDQILGESRNIPYADLIDQAEKAPAGSNGLIFLPYIAGERTPHMNADARGMLLGLTIEHRSNDIIRAVMEGVAMACYDAFSVLKELGARPEQIIMAGGGARSRLWRQIVADVFNLPVQSPHVWEQAAYGAAILAGSGIGFHNTSQAAVEWPSYETPVEPDHQRHEQYLKLFDIYRSAYHALRLEGIERLEL
jgi:xylulokinase